MQSFQISRLKGDHLKNKTSFRIPISRDHFEFHLFIFSSFREQAVQYSRIKKNFWQPTQTCRGSFWPSAKWTNRFCKSPLWYNRKHSSSTWFRIEIYEFYFLRLIFFAWASYPSHHTHSPAREQTRIVFESNLYTRAIILVTISIYSLRWNIFAWAPYDSHLICSPAREQTHIIPANYAEEQIFCPCALLSHEYAGRPLLFSNTRGLLFECYACNRMPLLAALTCRVSSVNQPLIIVRKQTCKDKILWVSLSVSLSLAVSRSPSLFLSRARAHTNPFSPSASLSSSLYLSTFSRSLLSLPLFLSVSFVLSLSLSASLPPCSAPHTSNPFDVKKNNPKNTASSFWIQQSFRK